MAFPCLGILQVSTFVLTLNPKKEIHLLTLMPSQMYMTFFLQTNTNKQGALKRNDRCVFA